MSSITRADVYEMLDSIVDRSAPNLANRTFALFRRLCNWACERGIIDASPCDRVKAPAPVVSRDRVLGDDELKNLWLACDGLGYPFGPLVTLLILTGQRRSEVAEMRWREVDLAAGLWTLPRERAKNNKEHAVPLAPAAIAILNGLPKIGEFVFTFGTRPVAGLNNVKGRLDALLLADMPPWIIHDVRRSFASGCARLGVAVHVVEALLNHRSGSIRGVAAVYNRYSYDPEKKFAAEAWARHVDQVVSGEPASNNVIAYDCMATKKKPGAILGRPKKNDHDDQGAASEAGRPPVPFLEDPERYCIAFYAAYRRYFRNLSGNRTLGANGAAIWLAALSRGDLWEGSGVGDIAGAPKDFVEKCPAGYVPVAVMRRGRDEPFPAEAMAGPSRNWRKIEVEATESGDEATLHWLTEAVSIGFRVIAAVNENNPIFLIEAKVLAARLGDARILNFVRQAPKLNSSGANVSH